MTEHAFLIAGLPGAGKTTVAQIGADITDGSVVESGEIVREMAAQDGLESPSSSELGEYAAEQREEQGPAFVAEFLVGQLLRSELDVDYPLFVDGIRHYQEVVEYTEYFDSRTVIWVDADPYTRLRRLQERGRDGEDGFDMLDLLQRDDRELDDLGVSTLIDDNQQAIDRAIPNTGSEFSLRRSVEETILRATGE